MAKKLTIITSLIVLSTSVLAQTNSTVFEKFALRQDTLFQSAYTQKDIPAYNRLLNEYLARYRDLDSAGKKNWSQDLAGAYYNFCCVYSLLKKTAPALDYLKKSIAAGYSDYCHMQEDSDLDNIRTDPGFNRLVEPLRDVGDFLYILKKAERYDTTDRSDLPTFRYQSASDPHLAELRKELSLDSIAGTGSEISKLLNLLHWIHRLVPHDGHHDIPTVKNAMSLIAACKKENRGLNCRGLAIVLNECYLSLGIPSRFITCLPKDSLHTDQDCHVITMAYSRTLNKWLWLDPTWDAYVMNERGELLSVPEVRDRLIHNQPLILNPDANWNNKESATKENYLYKYMAKNLYRLECPASSEYDLETHTDGKAVAYIQLLPLDYFKQTPRVDSSGGTPPSYTCYKTNNPMLFWRAP